MQPISFELCIQCFFKFSLMHKKRILSDPLFVFLPYCIVRLILIRLLPSIEKTHAFHVETDRSDVRRTS